MIVPTGTKGRGTVFTSDRTPCIAWAIVDAVVRVIHAVEVARGVTAAVSQALLFNVTAELTTLESQCIIPKP